LLVLGDSIAEGVGDAVPGYPDRSWADQLASALRSQYLNLGRHGARAGEVRASQLVPGLAFRPDLAVVAAGANDALRRSFDDPAAQAAVATELTRIVGALKDAGALVVTFGCFDLGRVFQVPHQRQAEVSDRLRALGRITEAITHRFGGVYVSFLDHPDFGEVLMTSDGVHVNRRGHAIVLTEVLRALGQPHAPVR
jgi:lysophospholipase L1-like esterase